MSCHRRSLVSAYLDGELSQQETYIFQRHLKECQECSQVHREFQRLGISLKERRVEDLPLGFFERLEARIELEREAAAPWQRLELTARRLVPAFVFLLLVAGLISFFPGSFSRTGPEALAEVFAESGESELLFSNYSGEYS